MTRVLNLLTQKMYKQSKDHPAFAESDRHVVGGDFGAVKIQDA